VSDAGERHAVACPRYLLPDRIVGLTDKGGIMHVLSYQIEQEVRDGSHMILFADDEPEPLPIHLVAPGGRLVTPKVHAFVDFAAIRLRARLQSMVAS
jgi:DNA-binding transcriptional LysR family regulator